MFFWNRVQFGADSGDRGDRLQRGGRGFAGQLAA